VVATLVALVAVVGVLHRAGVRRPVVTAAAASAGSAAVVASLFSSLDWWSLVVSIAVVFSTASWLAPTRGSGR
jgi:hypothetical protein